MPEGPNKIEYRFDIGQIYVPAKPVVKNKKQARRPQKYKTYWLKRIDLPKCVNQGLIHKHAHVERSPWRVRPQNKNISPWFEEGNFVNSQL